MAAKLGTSGENIYQLSKVLFAGHFVWPALFMGHAMTSIKLMLGQLSFIPLSSIVETKLVNTQHPHGRTAFIDKWPKTKLREHRRWIGCH